MRIYMENVPASMTEKDLERLFSVYGRVNHVHIVYAGKSRNALIDMKNHDDGASAIEHLNGRELYGHHVTVYEESDHE